jgi:hypothetical protein
MKKYITTIFLLFISCSAIAGPYKCLFAQKYRGSNTNVYFTVTSCGSKSDKLPASVTRNQSKKMQTMWVRCSGYKPSCRAERASIRGYVVKHKGNLPVQWHAKLFQRQNKPTKKSYSNYSSKSGIWCISYNVNSPTGNKSLGKFLGFSRIEASKVKYFSNKWRVNYTLNSAARKYGLYSMLNKGYLPTKTLESHVRSGKDVRCGCYIYQPSSKSRGWAAPNGSKSCYTLQKASDRFESLRKYK